ncbi:MAG TPA: hypothetical protein VFS40_16595 [Gemmatimonadales bacterium]|nr:hypothetical protein [Gemmatimonadales bacterium]
MAQDPKRDVEQEMQRDVNPAAARKAQAADVPVTDEEVREESYAGAEPQGDGDPGEGRPQRGDTLEDVALDDRPHPKR